jgi:Cu+-exporting ATPase
MSRRAVTAPPATGPRTIRIPVTGMTCAACQSRVQRTLQKQPGVSDATVNLILNDATITFDPATTSPDALLDAIREDRAT